MPRPLAEQTFVITGASSGLGLATAQLAARQGARVVLAARHPRDLEAAAEAIRAQGGEALAVPTDVTDFEQVQALAGQAVQRYHRIDTWVNGAAVVEYGTFEDTPVEDFRRILEVNVMGQVHGAKAALPHLRESRGALVCIGSITSDRGVPLLAAYSASKAALKGWIDALRVELAKEGAGVRVTLVKPASIDTPFFEHARTWLGVKPQGFPPVYSPELVAEAVLHAATHDDRDVYVGGMGKAMALLERISPRLVDAQQRLTAFTAQRTDEPRAPDDASNLWAPTRDGAVRGGARRVHERALFPWGSKRPWLLPLATVALLALARRGFRGVT